MNSDYQSAIAANFGVGNAQGVEIYALETKRLNSDYTNKDFNWTTAVHSGDIYVSTPDDTHALIVAHHHHSHDVDYNGKFNLPEDGYPGTSGFFTNEETASRSFTEDGAFDSVRLGHDLQQAPYFDDEKQEAAKLAGQTYFPEYNANLDCFRVNEEKMLANYGTTDLYAAQARCLENTAWGEGGGYQAFNSWFNQMINNGSLEYVPEKSRTCGANSCFDYASRKAQAQSEAAIVNDHIESNGIKGNPGARLEYNEISQSLSLSSGATTASQNHSASGIETICGGGGARAPNGQSAGPSLSDIGSPRKPQSPDSYVSAGPSSNHTFQGTSPTERAHQNNAMSAGPASGIDFNPSMLTGEPVQAVKAGSNPTPLPTADGAQGASKSVSGGIT